AKPPARRRPQNCIPAGQAGRIREPRVYVAHSGTEARATGVGIRLYRKREIPQPGRSHRVSRGVTGAEGWREDVRHGAQAAPTAELALSAVGTGRSEARERVCSADGRI